MAERQGEKTRRYAIYDVFTDRPLAGNPLAVVLDADGLDDEAMQAVAREFNLSETVFVSKPENPTHAAALRIFTPAHELPFAGHPTVGTAIALHEEGAAGAAADMAVLVLEEKVGDVRCAIRPDGDVAFAEFDLPRLPEALPFEADIAAIGAALGLDPHDMGFENHAVGLWSAGVPYVTIPVAGLETIGRARQDPALWAQLAPRVDGIQADAFVYCREARHHDSAFHARMFASSSGIPEDPATGSAVAALAGAIVEHDEPVPGLHNLWIEQGIEMGRPSRIGLELTVEGTDLTHARIGGHAVRIAQGELLL